MLRAHPPVPARAAAGVRAPDHWGRDRREFATAGGPGVGAGEGGGRRADFVNRARGYWSRLTFVLQVGPCRRGGPSKAAPSRVRTEPPEVGEGRFGPRGGSSPEVGKVTVRY